MLLLRSSRSVPLQPNARGQSEVTTRARSSQLCRATALHPQNLTRKVDQAPIRGDAERPIQA